jgi:hypothetical protein
MAVTTGQSEVPAGARWHLLLRPRWLGWHAFVVVATVGMLLLGDWQLRRAQAGNELSWAYTFEWPLFSAFTVFFWIKSLRDELRGHGAAGSASAEADRATAAATATGMTTDVTAPAKAAGAAAGATARSNTAPASGHPASWDATSWDAVSWDATSREAAAAPTGKPVDVARATPADGEAYVARLMAEVRGPARRRGRR